MNRIKVITDLLADLINQNEEAKKEFEEKKIKMFGNSGTNILYNFIEKYHGEDVFGYAAERITADDWMQLDEHTQDNEDPVFLYHLTATSLLVAIANNYLDTKMLAAKELKNRGLDLEGNWVGFKS